MGEHNAEVLGEAGFTADEIAGLRETGLIARGTQPAIVEALLGRTLG